MLTAKATHLHDKGLVNYLKILIWSIRESCTRLHGQSEPPDSAGLHYLWEPQKWDWGSKRLSAATTAAGSCFMCIKSFPFAAVMNISQGLKLRWDHLSNAEQRGRVRRQHCCCQCSVLVRGDGVTVWETHWSTLYWHIPHGLFLLACAQLLYVCKELIHYSYMWTIQHV